MKVSSHRLSVCFQNQRNFRYPLNSGPILDRYYRTPNSFTHSVVWSLVRAAVADYVIVLVCSGTRRFIVSDINIKYHRHKIPLLYLIQIQL
jgi:hypothetical protein